jgi:hypothetical protein
MPLRLNDYNEVCGLTSKHICKHECCVCSLPQIPPRSGFRLAVGEAHLSCSSLSAAHSGQSPRLLSASQGRCTNMCVCMYVCMYASVCVYISIRRIYASRASLSSPSLRLKRSLGTYLCIYVFTYIRTYTNTLISVSQRRCASMHACMYVCTYIFCPCAR